MMMVYYNCPSHITQESIRLRLDYELFDVRLLTMQVSQIVKLTILINTLLAGTSALEKSGKRSGKIDLEIDLDMRLVGY
jgi:hypothetical protein